MSMQKGPRATQVVAPHQMVSFFEYGFEPSRSFNPYQVYEQYVSSLGLPEDFVFHKNPEKWEDAGISKIPTGFIEYLVANDYGRYVEPEEINASDMPVQLFFTWFLIPTADDVSQLMVKASAFPELYLTQFEVEKIASAYHTREFVKELINRTLFFAGMLMKKENAREQLVKVIDAADRGVKYDLTDVAIKNQGFALNQVGEGDGDPQFVYTTGLVDKVGYEIIVAAALPLEIMSHIVFMHGKASIEKAPLQVGDLDSGLEYSEGNPIPARVVEASGARLYERFVCQTRADKPRVLQILLADENGKLPGDEGYNQKFLQPILVDHK